jgi:hypothetical protein
VFQPGKNRPAVGLLEQWGVEGLAAWWMLLLMRTAKQNLQLPLLLRRLFVQLLKAHAQRGLAERAGHLNCPQWRADPGLPHLVEHGQVPPWTQGTQ